MTIEPIAAPVMPVAPGRGNLFRWARDIGRVLTVTLRGMTTRINQAVFTSDNQTITGEKTFVDTTEIFDILAGPRFRTNDRGGANPQPSTNDSDTWMTTTGAITINNSANGWRGWFELGGDHDFTFDGATLDISAESPAWVSGDVVFFVVPQIGTVRGIHFPGGELVTEADFTP